MTDHSTFQEGNTLTILAGDTPVTGRIVHLSARRMELALEQPYGWLFNLFRPAYFSRFLLGDGFLGPEGEPFAREMLHKLYRAADYLHHQLPPIAEAMRAETSRRDLFLRHLDPLVDLNAALTPTSLRATVLHIEAVLTPRGMEQPPMVRWQQPILTGLLEVQASVLLHRWLREGLIDLRAQPGTVRSADADKERPLPSQHALIRTTMANTKKPAAKAGTAPTAAPDVEAFRNTLNEVLNNAVESTMDALHPAYFTIAFRTEAPQEHWPDQFVILTAYATTGETWSDERNTEADQRLYAELLRRGCTPIRITGYDPHSGHAEPGWAAELPLQEALEMGQLFLQDSIFRVDGDVLTVSRCGHTAESATVGGFRQRVRE